MSAGQAEEFSIQPYGHSVVAPLCEHEYRRIIIAKNFILNALRFEENYQLVLKSYFELEKNTYNESLSSLLIRDYGYDRQLDSMLYKDLKSLSFLAGFKSYRDRFPMFHGKDGPGSAFAKARSLWGAALLSSSEFAACEALRNFSIHRGASVHAMSYGHKLDESREHQEAFTYFLFSVDELKASEINEGRRADFCEDLRAKYGDKVNVFNVIRKALSELGKIHNEMRGLLNAELHRSNETMREAIGRIEELVPNYRTGSAVYAKGGEVVQETDLFDELPDRALRLSRRAVLENIETHFITSKLPTN